MGNVNCTSIIIFSRHVRQDWRCWCSQSKKEQPRLPSAQFLLGEWETRRVKEWGLSECLQPSLHPSQPCYFFYRWLRPGIAQANDSRAGSRAKVPWVQRFKDNFYREWRSSPQTWEDHRGSSQLEGRYFVVLDTKPNRINYRMKKTAVCKTFCLEQNLPAREPDPQEDHASSPSQAEAWQFQAPVLFENGGSSSGGWFLPFSWTYLHYFRWYSWGDQQTRQQEWWPDSYFYSRKSSFRGWNENSNPQLH